MDSINILGSINRTSPLVGLFSLIVKQVGARPYHGSFNGEASACVALFVEPETKKAAVMMTDGNCGASITNSVEEIIDFIRCQHLEHYALQFDDVRWLYRDSGGDWDELLATRHAGRPVAFRPCGSRTQADALARLRADNLELDEADMRCLVNFLRLD